jgi:hypothetical protein
MDLSNERFIVNMKVLPSSITPLHVIHVGHADTLRLRYTKMRETFAIHVGRLGLNRITTPVSFSSSVVGV